MKMKMKTAKEMTIDEKIAEFPEIFCSKCCETKSRDSFYNHKRTRSGKDSWCKSCVKAYTKANSKDYRDSHQSKCLLHRMLDKCHNPNSVNYPNYGGRGIKVYLPWHTDEQMFDTWLTECLGPKPDSTYSLDRIDNDGHYEPGNLRWASRTLQNVNQRSSYYAEFNAPDGTTYISHNTNCFCNKNGLTGSAMTRIINGKYCSTHYKGWTAVKIKNPTLEQVRLAEITDEVPAGAYTDSFTPNI